VCIANNVGAPGNDVYIISGATNAITNTLTSGGGLPPGTESFTGGTCNTCAQGINSVNHTGFLSIGTSTGADFQPFDLTTGTLGTPIASGQLSTAENIVVDPVRNLVLSPNENYGGGTNDYQLLNISTGSVYDFSPTTTPPILGINGDFDSAGEDCTTGIALSTVEFTGQLFITDLTQATFTGTSWSAPYSANDFPEFDALSAGTSGIAIAPNSHLGVVAGEFGGNLFGAIQLPATSGGGTPTLVDWVQAAIPTDPGGFDFANGFDPHTVTAYTSPTSGLNYAVFADYATESPSYLAIVDLQALLALPRSAPGAHTLATPLTNPTPVVTFIKL
jgi:hypothetical protein